ncbi:MAG: ornithine racemase Orr [Turicibacter sp.]|nr:ornithine racemase Orr [Turicibacter sp.]
MYPKLMIDLDKLTHNTHYLVNKMKHHDLSITAITKLYGADSRIISVFESFPEIEYFGDSRIKNLQTYQHTHKKKVLIRIPMPSEVEDVIKYADISFNSEISTIRLLNEAAKQQGKTHRVLLMIDLGDLREGFFEEEEWLAAIAELTHMTNVKLIGLGVNLMCYGGIIPDAANLGKLVACCERVEQAFNLKLEMVSGGNSSSLYLLDKDSDATLPPGITNLRIGDAFFTGESSLGTKFADMHGDVFTLAAEIIELKEKPSYPIGQIDVDAFGKVPKFEDKGNRLKGILAVGRQDVAFDGLYPDDEALEIIGASSDHLIVDFTESARDYKVGDVVKFRLHYGAVLQAFTSQYVTKEYIG